MSVSANNNTILALSTELNIKKTFECGQCFRWNADDNGIYSGVAFGKPLRVHESGGKIVCDCEDKDIAFWRDYFDMEADYAASTARLTEPEYLRTCAEFGAGIRILRQEPWEALCSFIISQCNNIPRIKGIIETLCAQYGDELSSGIYSFPDPEKLAPLSEADLAPLRSGYRAAYILDAARAVTEGRLDFSEIARLSAEEALEKIKQINGIGNKVANCFMLYGMHRMDRFPVDVWMKRALNEHFPADYDPSVLGADSGLAQQYIFYYTREVGKGGSQKLENC